MSGKTVFRVKAFLERLQWGSSTLQGRKYCSLVFRISKGESPGSLAFMTCFVQHTGMLNVIQTFFEQNKGKEFPLRIKVLESKREAGVFHPFVEMIGGPL